MITRNVRPELHAYMSAVVRNLKCECYEANGIEDHVHFAIRLARTITVADLLEEIKKAGTKWLKQQSPEFAEFSWQRGYAAYSVSPQHLEALRQYIRNQEEHHKTETFQQEYLNLAKRSGAEYDERYMWD